MNITIVQTFTDGFTTYQSGQELSVPSEVAQRWIADGKAQADTDGQQSWLSSTEVAATRALVSADGNGPALQALSRGMLAGHRPHIGTRIPGGPLLVVTAGANPTYFDATSQIVATTARKPYAVQLIFAGYAASVTAGIKCAVSAGSSVSGTAANNSAGSWTAVTFGGASTGTIPARQSATRQSWYLSDWVELDASTKIVVARCYVPAAGNTELTVSDFSQNSADSAGRLAWATTTGDEWVNRRQSVDGIASPTAFTTAGQINFSPIIGIRYLTTEGVVTIGCDGDSIMAGTYSTLAYDAHWARAVRALKLAGYGVEAVNLGWSGQTTSEYYLRALDALQYLGLQHLIYAPWSPNDGGDNPTQALVAGMRARWARVMLQADQYRCNVIPITGMPKTVSGNTASAWTDAEDDLRRTLNAEVRACPIYLDPDAVVGNRNAAGLAAATYSSNDYPASGSEVHLSEAGNEACKASMQTVLQGLLSVVAPA